MSPRESRSRPSAATGPSQPSTHTAGVNDLTEALASCDPDEGPNPWHDLWYEALRDRARPTLITEDAITPAASLWTGARLWTRAFRDAGLVPGDRLVLALAPSPAFVQGLVAALWESLTVALLPPGGNVDAAVDVLDARAAVAPEPHPYAWTPDGCSGPRTAPDAPRSPSTDPTPDVRFLLQTSGTTGPARWVALSDRNVLSVLASHLPHFDLHGARVLSVLPWSHAFGLVLDLLPALLTGAELIRDPEGGRSASSLVSLHDAWGATHLNAVPLTVERLLEHEDGPSVLGELQGGVVGGAPISAPLADALSQTHLRVGYGQTEASPGITLGAPGEWAANVLGVPVGCEVDVTEDGELRFRGPNACLGVWRNGRLDRADPDRWVRTGDLVKQEGDRFYFRGRTDDTFTLSNGRQVRAGTWEARLKQQFDRLQDALVYTHGGRDVRVALCWETDTAGSPPSQDAVRDALGSLGSRLDGVRVVAPDEWIASPKGEVDRRAMTAFLMEDSSPRPS